TLSKGFRAAQSKPKPGTGGRKRSRTPSFSSPSLSFSWSAPALARSTPIWPFGSMLHGILAASALLDAIRTTGRITGRNGKARNWVSWKFMIPGPTLISRSAQQTTIVSDVDMAQGDNKEADNWVERTG